MPYFGTRFGYNGTGNMQGFTIALNGAYRYYRSAPTGNVLSIPSGQNINSFLVGAELVVPITKRLKFSGELAYAGRVTMNGRDLAAMKAWEAASVRAVLPQATALSFPFTVREIVKLGLSGGRTGALASEEGGLPERALARGISAAARP